MALSKVKTMNGHAEPVTRAWNAELVRLERRLVEVADASEQQIETLRDAIADFVAAEMAERDNKILTQDKRIADLEQQLAQASAIDRKVAEAAAQIEQGPPLVMPANAAPKGKRVNAVPEASVALRAPAVPQANLPPIRRRSLAARSMPRAIALSRS